MAERIGKPTGPSQAEPEDVSALRASVPCAYVSHDGPRMETGPVQFGDDWPGVFFRGDEALALAMCLGQEVPRLSPLGAAYLNRLTTTLQSCHAQAIEARRAETLGSVHESAVATPCAPQPPVIKG